MTEPRRKELFDEDKFKELVMAWENGKDGIIPNRRREAQKVLDFIQSEIQRNLKDEREKNIDEICGEINATGQYDFKNGSCISFKNCEWVKNAVREFADQVRPTDRDAQMESRIGYITQEKIDIALKELGIE